MLVSGQDMEITGLDQLDKRFASIPSDNGEGADDFFANGQFMQNKKIDFYSNDQNPYSDFGSNMNRNPRTPLQDDLSVITEEQRRSSNKKTDSMYDSAEKRNSVKRI